VEQGVKLPDPDIFISYNREDGAIAQVYRDALVREGYDVWWDATLRSGETYDEVTEAALRAAKAVVVLWSPRSVASRWVRAEATIADRNRTLLPATIEPCDRPVMFELTQTKDLSHWQGEARDPAWQAFLGDVRRMVGCDMSVAKDGGPLQELAPSFNLGIPRIGVLPFTFRGDNDELETLAEDLTEDITRAFAENGYFKVIAAGTMTAWRGKVRDYRVIGRELDARYLAEGKLQPTNDAFRLTVELIDTETDNCVWSHRFMASAAELASNADEFPLLVAAELVEEVLQAETARAMAKPSHHTSWEHVLRAIAFSFGRAANGKKSLEEARLAVAAAPDYGLAHAALAGATNAVASFAGRRLDDALKRELHDHATRALQLDGDNPAVLLRLWQAHISLGDGETMLRLARRLVELRPYSANSYHALSGAYFTLGRTKDAIAACSAQLTSKGHDRNLAVAHWTIGWCYLLEGQLPEAEAALERALALIPNMVRALQFKAIVEALLGREKIALATIRRLRDVAPEETLDQLTFFMAQNPRLGRRSGEHIATLQRLWDATGSHGYSRCISGRYWRPLRRCRDRILVGQRI
jgi:TolB-like protein